MFITAICVLFLVSLIHSLEVRWCSVSLRYWIFTWSVFNFWLISGSPGWRPWNRQDSCLPTVNICDCRIRFRSCHLRPHLGYPTLQSRLHRSNRLSCCRLKQFCCTCYRILHHFSHRCFYIWFVRRMLLNHKPSYCLWHSGSAESLVRFRNDFLCNRHSANTWTADRWMDLWRTPELRYRVLLLGCHNVYFRCPSFFCSNFIA